MLHVVEVAFSHAGTHFMRHYFLGGFSDIRNKMSIGYEQCSSWLINLSVHHKVYYHRSGVDLGSLPGGGSESVVVTCRSTYEPGGGGGTRRHMCRYTYRSANINRLLILQALRLH